MFCSTECYDESMRRYHRYECPVIDQLLKSGSVHMALRLLFIALSTFNESIGELEDFLKRADVDRSTIFDCSTEGVENEKSLLLCLTSLVRSQKVFALNQHEKILRNHPTLKALWSDHQEFIKSFLLRQCQISDLNFHGIFSRSSQRVEAPNPSTIFSSLQQTIGCGSLLFASLINHSCANNLLRVCVEGNVVFVVCRPIAKGSQLFDCYK